MTVYRYSDVASGEWDISLFLCEYYLKLQEKLVVFARKYLTIWCLSIRKGTTYFTVSRMSSHPRPWGCRITMTATQTDTPPPGNKPKRAFYSGAPIIFYFMRCGDGRALIHTWEEEEGEWIERGREIQKDLKSFFKHQIRYRRLKMWYMKQKVATMKVEHQERGQNMYEGSVRKKNWWLGLCWALTETAALLNRAEGMLSMFEKAISRCSFVSGRCEEKAYDRERTFCEGSPWSQC